MVLEWLSGRRLTILHVWTLHVTDLRSCGGWMAVRICHLSQLAKPDNMWCHSSSHVRSSRELWVALSCESCLQLFFSLEGKVVLHNCSSLEFHLPFKLNYIVSQCCENTFGLICFTWRLSIISSNKGNENNEVASAKMRQCGFKTPTSGLSQTDRSRNLPQIAFLAHHQHTSSVSVSFWLLIQWCGLTLISKCCNQMVWVFEMMVVDYWCPPCQGVFHWMLCSPLSDSQSKCAKTCKDPSLHLKLFTLVLIFIQFSQLFVPTISQGVFF